MSTRRLDLRALPPPLPMDHILQALADLQPRDCLLALTPMRPLPLLPLLDGGGFAWRLRDLPAGGAAIAIRHRTGPSADGTPSP